MTKKNNIKLPCKMLKLKKGKENIASTYHPWIFSGALERHEKLPNGEIVQITPHHDDDNILGVGYYTNGSIAVRMLAWQPAQIDQTFWTNRIRNAYNLKQEVINGFGTATNAYRLINGEGDGIPGLIVDVYNNHIVIECHNQGIKYLSKTIKQAIEAVEPFHKSEIIIRTKGEEKSKISTETIISENGIKFCCDINLGQKTGFFLDQRNNRQLLAHYAKGKKMANLFCYTGGFSIYGLTHGAEHMTSVDISQSAVDMVTRNSKLNGIDSSKHEIICADVMKWLGDQPNNSYDVMVVDPPAFAKSRNKKHNAVQAYKRLNVMAIKKVKPGGKIFTFSCSQVISRELFIHTIRSAAMETGRRISVLKYLSQGEDHTIDLYHLEGHYLKGLLLHVG